MSKTYPLIEYATGCTRQVILLHKYAVKIPSFHSWENFLNGLLGNMQETMLSKFWSRNGVIYHCPVIFSAPGGFLNIMLRARILTDDEFKNFDFETICGKLEYKPENKSNSFGYLEGRIVCIDYGS